MDRYCIVLQPSNSVGLGCLSNFFAIETYTKRWVCIFFVSRNKVPAQWEILIRMWFLVGKVVWPYIREDENKVPIWPYMRGNPRICNFLPEELMTTVDFVTFRK